MKSKELYELHASICQCLAGPKRLEIIDALRQGELTATALAGALETSSANVSRHLTRMRSMGILLSRREGVNIFYSLANPRVVEACDIMREVLLEVLSQRRKLAKKAAG